MTSEVYFKCVIACLIGNICHVVWKMFQLNRDYKKANEVFNFKKYFAGDWPAIAIDVIFSFAIVYIADELVIHSDYLMNKVKILFLFVGFSGSFVFHSLMSVSDKYLRKIVDSKTNELDFIKGKTDV